MTIDERPRLDAEQHAELGPLVRIIEEAAVESDLATRQQLYRIAERILVQDQVGVIPIYWYADNSLTKPHVDRPQTPQFMKLFKDWQVN